MDITEIISNLIAGGALFVAWSAKRRSDEAFKVNSSLQKRLEVYNHFPILSLRLEPDGKRVRLVVVNSSATNPIRKFEVKYVLRIRAANNTFHVDREDIRESGGLVAPSTENEIYSEEINDIIDKSIPFLSEGPSEKNHFVLNAEVKCYPPHPESQAFFESVTAFFELVPGLLELKLKEDGTDQKSSNQRLQPTA